MRSLPPERNEGNQNQHTWSQWIDTIEREFKDVFHWLVDKFSIKKWDVDIRGKKEELEVAITDPKTLLNMLNQLQHDEAALKKYLERIEIENPPLFNWLLRRFCIDDWHNKAENLSRKIKDAQTLCKVFAELQQSLSFYNKQRQDCKIEIDYLERQNKDLFTTLLKLFEISSNIQPSRQREELETKFIDTKSSVKAFSVFYENYTNIYFQLKQSKDKENQIRQELDGLQQNQRNFSYYEEKIKELEQQNQSLRKRSDEMFSTLSKQNRNEVTTITSNDSRRQRDILSADFKNLANQDFKRVTIQILNLLISNNPDLRNSRLQEEAKIRSILSQRILIDGISWVNEDNNASSNNDFLKLKAQGTTQIIIQDIKTHYTLSQFINNDDITLALDSLTQKGIELVRDITNDQPPGQLWIENAGTIFNRDEHEEAKGCDSGGIVLYTTYPGYRIEDRILEKVIVFTTPVGNTEETIPVVVPHEDGISSETNEINVDPNSSSLPTELNSAEKVKALIGSGLSDYNIAYRIGVSVATIHNWRKETNNPSSSNAESLDKLYKEFVPKSSSNGLDQDKQQTIFCGTVKNQHGCSCYPDPRSVFIHGSQLYKLHDRLTFDMKIEGQEIFDSVDRRNDNMWFRIAGQNVWVPRAHIRLDD